MRELMGKGLWEGEGEGEAHELVLNSKDGLNYPHISSCPFCWPTGESRRFS